MKGMSNLIALVTVEGMSMPFCIESEITREERYQESMRTADAMRYQQSMALLRKQGTMGART
jgi:hypothetical protein